MATLGFYGGVGSVTGANFMLDIGEFAFLVDCGLIQGDRFVQAKNSEPFVYNAADVDVLLVTHAHADHIGRIPKLIKEGFAGVIYSTEPTRMLANVMLHDAYKVMLYEEERYGVDRLYEEKDIDAALALWQVHDYQEPFALPGDVTATFTDAGHILGSAMIHLVRNGKKIVFTGDIGNVPQPLLNAPQVPTDYDYMVMESVYGDRTHEEVHERTELLREHIEDTRDKGGTLMIPAFSLERTQGMLFEINNLIERGGMKPLPVFLDSPLAISVTDIYRRFIPYLKDDVQAQIHAGDDIFAFNGLKVTKSVAESREIAKVQGPKIIIAGSGMSHGGRILDHEQRYLEDKRNTLLLVGYQAVGSVGRLLNDGVQKVRILEADVQVRATIARIRGYSGHADRTQLVDLVAGGARKAKQIFVTMGEEKSSLHLVQRLRDYVGVNAVAPSENQEIEIDF